MMKLSRKRLRAATWRRWRRGARSPWTARQVREVLKREDEHFEDNLPGGMIAEPDGRHDAA